MSVQSINVFSGENDPEMVGVIVVVTHKLQRDVALGAHMLAVGAGFLVFECLHQLAYISGIKVLGILSHSVEVDVHLP